MTSDQSTIAIAAIMTTLAEVESAPQGIMWTALQGQMSFSGFQSIVGLLRTSGNVEDAGYHQLRITDAGRALAAKLNAAIKESDHA